VTWWRKMSQWITYIFSLLFLFYHWEKKPTKIERIMNTRIYTVKSSQLWCSIFSLLSSSSFNSPSTFSIFFLNIVISIDDFFCHHHDEDTTTKKRRLRGIELLIKLDLSSYNQILAYFHRLHFSRFLIFFHSLSCCQLPLRGLPSKNCFKLRD
jgi:hypothetical protein